ncbi:type I restriction endonuclease subunit R [Persephonella sp.]|uniref:type I restriction endonuclease subunit R n=1 Tax=Persephonella sp. TaxID=2060922 RepID=UPI002612896F|nr:type I restriction endonuclease subunit R [Persephonella sp.]
MSNITEDKLVEQPALDWLEGEGWDYIHGSQLIPENQERENLSSVILKNRFLESLKKINPHIPETTLEEVYKRLLSIAQPSLEHTNLNFHKLLINGVPVEYKDSKGNIKTDIVKLIDFKNPENNQFLVANQFVVKEVNKDGVRFDIVLFINGLPIALFELKNLDRSLKEAYRQIQNYKELAPQIFYYNEILVISNLLETRIGSLTASYDRFSKWRGIKDKYDYQEDTIPSLEVLIKGLFNKERLLEYIKDFVVFEKDGETIIKKIAMYHQFYDVRKAIKNTLKALNSTDKRIGTFWHTQGSGKSLSMVFYVRKAIKSKELKNPTVVMLTDRTELDDQLSKTFLKTELKEYVEIADSIKDLREKLDKKSGGIIFTTIQKFQLTDEERKEGKKFPTISERENIIIIADEAHRSQYKKFAQNVRLALPNAMFIGFTGTPIETDDRSTTAVFGDYAGVYTIKNAVEDGTIVPIYYEARFTELHLAEHFLDLEFEDITKAIEEEKKEGLKKRFSTLEMLIRNPDRLEKIAKDIVRHFNSLELDTKAMVVCVSRAAAVEMYNLMKKQPNCPEIAVVMSGSKSHDPQEFWPHTRSQQEIKELATRFKNPDDPLKIVIVVDMWLTGFDAPVVSTMYIDKPMKNHSLLQAIARVNRVYPGKTGGLIVDYIGITDDLKKSLSVYTQDIIKDAVIPIEDAVKLMLEKYEIVKSYLGRINFENWKKLSNTEQARLLQEIYTKITKDPNEMKEFLKQVSALTKAFALVSTEKEAIEIKDDLEFFQNVARIIRKYNPHKELDISDEIENAVKHLVDKSVKASKIKNIFGIDTTQEEVSIFDPDFIKYLNNISNKEARIKVFESLLKDQIKVRLKRNKAKRKSFQERIDELIKKYNNRILTVEEVINQLQDLAKELKNINACREKLGLSEEEEAFYDLLIGTSDCKYDERIINVAKELTEKIKSQLIIDWTKSEQHKAKVRTAIKRILRKHKFKATSKLVNFIYKQAEELYKDYPIAA